jgi:beta-mannosidase
MKTLSLNGKWNFIEDPELKLDYDEVFILYNGNKIKKTMTLPVNWQIAGLNNFNGAVWFIKTIENFTPAENSVNILKFWGVDYFAEVWVNGNRIGGHEGYFQPFDFEITPFLTRGENLIVVKVVSPKETPGEVWPLKKQLIKGIFNHHDCRPGAWNLETGQDQNTGGVWNDIELYYESKAYIRNIKISSKIINEGAFARTIIKLTHSNVFKVETVTETDVSIYLNEKRIQKSRVLLNFAPVTGEAAFTVEIPKPALWSSWDSGAQNIYRVEIKSPLFGSVSENFGIKEVWLDEKKNFFLNGKKLFLRGTNIIPTQFLSEFTKEKIQKLASLLKEANVNIVRVHAHVNRKELYAEFDKAGILVWQDFALQWTYDDSEKFVTNSTRQIREMVSLLHNYPSIAVWCCHNEPGEQIKKLDPFLYDAVLAEDNSRIIRLASNYEEHPYDGWYWGKKEHYAAAPMGPLVTEFGAQALPELDSLRKFLSPQAIKKYDWKEWEYHDFQYDQTFNITKISKGKNINDFIVASQKYQAEVLRTAIDFYRRKKGDGITGIFQFMFIDCWPSITWSVVDFYGRKKAGFETLKSAYEPLYLSVNLRQDSYLLNSKVNTDLYIINDLYRNFKELSVVYKADGVQIGEIKNIKAEPDSVKFINWESINIIFPAELKPGGHDLEVCLLDNKNGKVVSERKFEIKLIEKL